MEVSKVEGLKVEGMLEELLELYMGEIAELERYSINRVGESYGDSLPKREVLKQSNSLLFSSSPFNDGG